MPTCITNHCVITQQSDRPNRTQHPTSDPPVAARPSYQFTRGAIQSHPADKSPGREDSDPPDDSCVTTGREAACVIGFGLVIVIGTLSQSQVLSMQRASQNGVPEGRR